VLPARARKQAHEHPPVGRLGRRPRAHPGTPRIPAPRGTGVSVTRRSPKPQRQVRFLGPPLGARVQSPHPSADCEVEAPRLPHGCQRTPSRRVPTVAGPSRVGARWASAPKQGQKDRERLELRRREMLERGHRFRWQRERPFDARPRERRADVRQIRSGSAVARVADPVAGKTPGLCGHGPPEPELGQLPPAGGPHGGRNGDFNDRWTPGTDRLDRGRASGLGRARGMRGRTAADERQRRHASKDPS
jgi:hypothetical protein